MVGSPESNVSLTDAEQQKIVLVQNRLTVLQGEVLEATKNLAAVEEAITQGQENKKYYDDLIEQMKPDVVSLEKRRDELKEEIRVSEQTLSQHTKGMDDMRAHFNAKKDEHDAREDTLRAQETSNRSTEEAHAKKDKELISREERIVKSEQVLRTALESLT